MEPDACSRARLGRNRIDQGADDNAALSHDHEFLAFVHHGQRRQRIALLAEFGGDDTHAASVLQAELADGDALAHAARGDDQHPWALVFVVGEFFAFGFIRRLQHGCLLRQNLARDNSHSHQRIVRPQAHRPDPASGPTEGTKLLIVHPEVNRSTLARPNNDAVLSGRKADPAQLIAFF